jgi:hypothetical protein
VMAVDATASVDDARFELQKQGYAEVFRNPQVIKAIASGGESSSFSQMHIFCLYRQP